MFKIFFVFIFSFSCTTWCSSMSWIQWVFCTTALFHLQFSLFWFNLNMYDTGLYCISVLFLLSFNIHTSFPALTSVPLLTSFLPSCPHLSSPLSLVGSKTEVFVISLTVFRELNRVSRFTYCSLRDVAAEIIVYYVLVICYPHSTYTIYCTKATCLLLPYSLPWVLVLVLTCHTIDQSNSSSDQSDKVRTFLIDTVIKNGPNLGLERRTLRFFCGP